MSVSSRSVLDNVTLPHSALYKGRFGRMFRNLSKWAPPVGPTDPVRLPDSVVLDRLRAFATNEMSESDPPPALDNDKIPAGYTYFGQFVDHDITFDPTSSLERANDPNKLNNFRTPRLDLDCLYGEGPADEPFMYDNQRGGMFLIGKVNVNGSSEPDLPRNVQGRALIGDMRNDENAIVSQIQLSMLRLHNRILEELMFPAAAGQAAPATFPMDGAKFAEAQRILRWFYQYVVWNDWVKKLIKDDLWGELLKLKDGVFVCGNRFYKWKHQPFIPIEFSVAAYRFGHSMVRPGYQVNLNQDVDLGFGVEKPIFNPNVVGEKDLHGFRFFQHRHTMQWDWFFEFQSSNGPFPQASRKIDPKLSSAIFKTPEGPKNPNLGNENVNHLAFLNLLRSWRIGLPTGTAVARYMGFTPLNVADGHEDILWHYILKEARAMPGANSGKMLGNVGGTIVGEVFAGLLFGDPRSYVKIDPRWTPANEPALTAIFDQERVNGPTTTPELNGDWQVADLLRAAGAPIDAADVAATIATGTN